MFEKEKFEEHYLALYRATPAIFHWDNAAFRLIHVSDLWLRTTGYSRRELLGCSWNEFLTEQSSRFASEEVLPELLRTGHMEGIEYDIVQKSGAVVNTVASTVLTYDERGAPLLSVTAITDVTTIKRLQRELTLQHKHLRVTLDAIN